MPVSSLPSRYGIGCFSKEAYDFVDKLHRAGQTYWQILPLGPTGYGDSPYQSFSSFAGNPYFIDLDTLAGEGLLSREELESIDFGSDETRVDYAKEYENRYTVLRKAYAAFKPGAEFDEFCSMNAYWLDDYSLFMALKNAHDGAGWQDWEDDIRLRRPEALEESRKKHADDIRFHKFLQYEFSTHWKRLKEYANSKDIRIIGDIPIYVSSDSADSWCSEGLFQFDDDRRLIQSSGCPPDAFSAEGQLWGNPLYDWDYHERTGFEWWIRRMKRCYELYDVIRVDHFRGFDEYYAIPAGNRTAAGGRWEKGPGMKLFNALQKEVGPGRVIAEDLGYVTQSVKQLVRDSGYPGMKVIEFAFDSRESGDYMPYNYPKHCVVYTGTHDNQTLKAWYYELSAKDKETLDDFLGFRTDSDEKRVRAIVLMTLETVAETAIIPMQDYLCLGSEARMNTPAVSNGNWQWRMKKDAFTDELAYDIYKMTKVSGRLRQDSRD